MNRFFNWIRKPASGLAEVGLTLAVWLAWGSLALALLMMSRLSHAASPGASTVRGSIADTGQLYMLAQRWVDQTLTQEMSRQASSGAPVLRMQATLGQLNPRLQLTYCMEAEAGLPPGQRLWGDTRIVLRCLQGEKRWQVSLPVRVQAFGPAWVLARNVAGGQELGPADLTVAEVDWAASHSPVLSPLTTDARRGTVVLRHLAPGQELRQNMVRAAKVFKAGAQVRVLVQGGGFAVSSRGQALSAGVAGQVVRVRLDSGRITSAKVIDEQTVQIEI